MAPIPNSRAGRLALVGLAAVIVAALMIWPRGKGKDTTAQRTPETPAHELTQLQGRWLWRRNTNDAFTGVMVERYASGNLRARVEISNGWPNGWAETWHTNGQAETREHFKGGVSDGERERWYANGRKQSQAEVVDGKVSGLFERWHENGQLAEKIQMKDGQPVGVAWAYYPSGFVKAETMIESGRPPNQKLWKDGEFKNVP